VTYQFDTDYAIKYGLDESILLQHIIYWIVKNRANDKNNFDGKTWTYNSIHAFSELFPFWTEKQIRRVLESLIKKGVIITGNYNKLAYDRTLWYALLDESILPIGHFHLTKKANGFDGMGEPIPDIIPDKNTHIREREERTAPRSSSHRRKKRIEVDRTLYPFYGVGEPVYLSDEEKKKLEEMYYKEDVESYITDVSLWQTEKRPKNDYLTILKWMNKAKVEKRKKPFPPCVHCGSKVDVDGMCRNIECPGLHDLKS
jgi:hypothetical protein